MTASVAVSIAAGVAVGIGTQVLQGVLPEGWSVLANSGVVWAIAAFALGTTMPTTRSAAIGGAVELVVAAVAYYAAVEWIEGQATGLRGMAIWSVVGIVAGAPFGVAGQLFRHRRAWRFRVLALLGGILLGEGASLVWLVGNPALRPAGATEIAVGILLLTRAATGSCWSGRTWPVVAIGICTAVVTVAAFMTIDLAFQRW